MSDLKFLENLYWAAHSNGYEKEIKDIVDEIVSTKRRFNFFDYREKTKNEEYHKEIEIFVEIIYSLFVEMYGDCGVSSRGGWIEDENINLFIKFKEFINEHYYEED